MLRIYNTLTREKEIFTPLRAKHVGLYVCGMTVYDYPHIGHARVLLIFDVIVRYLRDQGYEVTYVRNITDIDDKIIARAKENHETVTRLTDRMVAAMHEDFARLSMLPPTQEPRATDAIAQIIRLIQTLMDQGYAYRATDGDVCYSVNQFQHYGELAHQDLTKLRQGSRIEIKGSKRDPLDFVLWKQAKPDEPSWDSPWGRGRPGWHIECSAMSMAALGEHFDLHGGGLDLVFPHHENEIAQSQAATGERFVNTWIHIGFVQVDQQKMSKSLGNFSILRDVLADYPAEVVRYFLVASHYRSPIQYSREHLQFAWAALRRLYISLKDWDNTLLDSVDSSRVSDVYKEKFNEAMDDDFNTPNALAVLFELSHEINRLRSSDVDKACVLAQCLKQQAGVLGLLQQHPEQFLRLGIADVHSEKIAQLIAARNQARAAQNWAEADRLRHDLSRLGVSINDTVSGTDWSHSVDSSGDVV